MSGVHPRGRDTGSLSGFPRHPNRGRVRVRNRDVLPTTDRGRSSVVSVEEARIFETDFRPFGPRTSSPDTWVSESRRPGKGSRTDDHSFYFLLDAPLKVHREGSADIGGTPGPTQ